ncbi:S-adenosyl-L-methionine-dependent methyltransferase [Mycena indigotica]|uniref:S-adenosyl-L-methionine-dependent methyltransferase n=1 Tax=Mycena indigotica TaxID=2126181 RepID=A0A8H6SBA2_9AGAR|nr:S-adenosyl-L-methionine-dependent methyltransferase [Mycena indigotica]KAF7295167.1 S-adenosyl-L-methionine-dependent methyltransferase [Mycena indigotica]
MIMSRTPACFFVLRRLYHRYPPRIILPAFKMADIDGPPAKKQKLNPPEKKAAKKNSKRQHRKDQRNSLPEPCSNEDVLWQEIKEVLGEQYVDDALEQGTERDSPFEFHQELQVQIVALSSTGSALATAVDSSRPWVIVVPFSLPGEIVRLKIYRNARLHSFGDFIELVKPNSELRDDSRVKCQYFGRCGGCQYQMLSYDTQLELKRDVVVKAYQKFSKLPQTALPPIGSTLPSPLQYEYRTKITPHFEAPTKKQRNDPNNPQNDIDKPDWFRIGMNEAGSQRVVDIEDCQIASPTIRQALPEVRANAVRNLYNYKKGVSLILRDSLPIPSADSVVDSLATDLDKHVCVTDHRGTIRERVGSLLFEYPASSFFQNNNSVLPSLTSYVEAQIFADKTYKPTHLVDAYCGAGLFAISLSPHFETVAGIELSADSIRAATRNAVTLNSIPASKISFRAGDAKDIFSAVGDFPPQDTVVIIDPPRKGCDEPFIKQLLAFRARTVVYVSCNVHTQARDVGMILNENREAGRGKYVLESLRGFDLFPQTAHVESVATLRLVEDS